MTKSISGLAIILLAGCSMLVREAQPSVSVQNNGLAALCRIECQAEGAPPVSLFRTDGRVGSPSPLPPGAIKTFELPGGDARSCTMRFWTCEGGALAERQVTPRISDAPTISVP
jgi:hypothetical protein